MFQLNVCYPAGGLQVAVLSEDFPKEALNQGHVGDALNSLLYSAEDFFYSHYPDKVAIPDRLTVYVAPYNGHYEAFSWVVVDDPDIVIGKANRFVLWEDDRERLKAHFVDIRTMPGFVAVVEIIRPEHRSVHEEARRAKLVEKWK